jgi:hypothetical protein
MDEKIDNGRTLSHIFEKKDFHTLFHRDTLPQWQDPLLAARQPGGGRRICHDYQGLDEVTIRERFSLPLIPDTLASMDKA